jgi:hypothetical protein
MDFTTWLGIGWHNAETCLWPGASKKSREPGEKTAQGRAKEFDGKGAKRASVSLPVCQKALDSEHVFD